MTDEPYLDPEYYCLPFTAMPDGTIRDADGMQILSLAIDPETFENQDAETCRQYAAMIVRCVNEFGPMRRRLAELERVDEPVVVSSPGQ